jgi:Cdc6-like AAA superfamily ATPase
MKKNSDFNNSFMIFNYNGMIFKKLYDFSTELIKDIRLKYYNKKSKNLESKLKQTDDVIDLGNRIQKYFLEMNPIHKLVIIDEVDNLSMTESAKNFVSFLHSVLKTDTNTTIIGIANSVDLLSKVSQYSNKEGELVEKKCIFGPYPEKDIMKIINKKLEPYTKEITWTKNIITPDALKFAAMKVAKISGDIRVAFDLIKSSMVQIILRYREEVNKTKAHEGGSEDETHIETHNNENSESNKESACSEKHFDIDLEKPEVGIKMVLYLTTTKFGIKSIETIRTLPTNLQLILKTLTIVFDDK